MFDCIIFLPGNEEAVTPGVDCMRRGHGNVLITEHVGNLLLLTTSIEG